VAYTVILRRPARKALSALPQEVQKRIVQALENLANDPRPPGARAVQGHDHLLRIRVGDYRVVYTVQDDTLVILVLRVGHRRDVYRGL
jgi:mRNA interferase RelE/StbE